MKLRLLSLLLLSATGFAQHKATLSCNASASSGVTGYNFYRGTAAGSESATPVNANPQSTCDYVDNTVAPLATYYYVAKAYCATCSPNLSIASNEIKVTIPGDSQPLPPTGLTAGTVAQNRVPLKWNRPANGQVIAYAVFRGPSPSLPNPAIIAVVSPDLTTFVDGSCSGNCYYEAKTYGIMQNKFVISAPSNIVKVTIK